MAYDIAEGIEEGAAVKGFDGRFGEGRLERRLQGRFYRRGRAGKAAHGRRGRLLFQHQR